MKVRGLARKEERSHNQPAKGDVILGQVQEGTGVGEKETT